MLVVLQFHFSPSSGMCPARLNLRKKKTDVVETSYLSIITKLQFWFLYGKKNGKKIISGNLFAAMKIIKHPNYRIWSQN